jgi:hypothetical protein
LNPTDLRAKRPSAQWREQSGVLFILNRELDRPDNSGRKLQLSLLDEAAAPVEHSDDEIPRGVVRVSNLVGISDRVDVHERAIPKQEQRGRQQSESDQSVSPA